MSERHDIDPREPLGRRLRPVLDATRLAVARANVEHRLRAPARSRAWIVIIPVLVLAAVAIGTWRVMEAPSPLLGIDGRALADIETHERPSHIGLADGSSIDVAPGTQLLVLESSSTQVAFALRAGSAIFDVTPGGPRRWSVESEGVSVEVVGTNFTVARSETSVRVSVARGVVVVRGSRVEDGARRLVAGETIDVALVSDDASRGDSMGLPSIAARSAPDESAIHDTVEDSAGIEAPTRPRRRLPAVIPPVGSTGHRDGSEPRALLAEADLARAAGDDARAEGLLTELLERHPDSPEAAFAALTLARLAEARGDRDDAHALYARALALGLPGRLARSVEARIAALEPEL